MRKIRVPSPTQTRRDLRRQNLDGSTVYDGKNTATVPGLMHVNLGGYHIKDIEFTIGIDISAAKVGKDMSEAIFAFPNNTYKFTDVPLNVETKLEVWDSPNSAGVLIDAVRCAKIALDRKLNGPIIGPSSYFFKMPPKQFRDNVCLEMTEAFIKGDSNE